MWKFHRTPTSERWPCWGNRWKVYTLQVLAAASKLGLQSETPPLYNFVIPKLYRRHLCHRPYSKAGPLVTSFDKTSLPCLINSLTFKKATSRETVNPQIVYKTMLYMIRSGCLPNPRKVETEFWRARHNIGVMWHAHSLTPAQQALSWNIVACPAGKHRSIHKSCYTNPQ